MERMATLTRERTVRMPAASVDRSFARAVTFTVGGSEIAAVTVGRDSRDKEGVPS